MVGRVVQNMRESKAVTLMPYNGVSGVPLAFAETVSYRNLFREVALGLSGSTLMRMVKTLLAIRTVYSGSL